MVHGEEHLGDLARGLAELGGEGLDHLVLGDGGDRLGGHVELVGHVGLGEGGLVGVGLVHVAAE
ncbi:hypothetical protein D3C72_2505540 [compost metagenome]